MPTFADPVKNRAASLAYYYAHREDVLSRKKVRYDADPQKIRDYKKKLYWDDPEAFREYRRNQTTGAKEIRASRPRPVLCEVCGGPPGSRYGKLHFDHDHATGEFRGWLCHHCNTGMGLARDNPEILKLWIKYLENGGPR